MRKFTKRPIGAASEVSEGFENDLDDLEDDFGYLVEGLSKLGRDGRDTEKVAHEIILRTSAAIKQSLVDVAHAIEK